MILDQPFDLEKSSSGPIKKKWTWFEVIVAGLVLSMATFHELTGWVGSLDAVMIVTSFLAVSYLIGNYWIDKPSASTLRSVVVTILYGVSYCSGTIAFLFLFMMLTGSKEMSYVAIAIVAVAIVADLVTSVNKTKVMTKHTLIRYCLFAFFVSLVFYIPQTTRVEFTYRNYPKFLKFYNEHKHEEFVRVHAAYLEQYGSLAN